MFQPSLYICKTQSNQASRQIPKVRNYTHLKLRFSTVTSSPSLFWVCLILYISTLTVSTPPTFLLYIYLSLYLSLSFSLSPSPSLSLSLSLSLSELHGCLEVCLSVSNAVT
eukprot:sb/3477179/